ncbi:MAG: YggT family protein [Clostridia bacterium]|nr:YggT family protein [Clostridia bacterium]
MLNVLAVLRYTVSLFLEVLQFMMLARAVFSWFPNLSDSALGDFLFTVTEWVITPVRMLFDKMGWGMNMMIDIPFFVTFILLSVLGSVL